MIRYFTKKQAEKLIDKKVVLIKDITGVKRGTAGKVSGYYQKGRFYKIEIKWEENELVDWFTKEEYYNFLEEQ